MPLIEDIDKLFMWDGFEFIEITLMILIQISRFPIGSFKILITLFADIS